MYKCILLDLDDTILDFKKSEYESIRLILEKYNLDAKDNIKLFQDINEDCFIKFQNGYYSSRIEFQLSRFKIFFNNFNLNVDYQKINKEFLDNLANIVFIYDDTISILKYLSSKYDIYACSNGRLETQISRLKNINIDKYFKGIYTSSQIGVTKPNIKFFNYINEKLKYKKDEYIIIGDRIDSDIYLAKNADIDSILVYSKSNLSTYCVDKLKDIKNIL